MFQLNSALFSCQHATEEEAHGVYVLSRMIHPSVHIRDKYFNPVKGHRLENCFVIHQKVKKIRCKDVTDVVFTQNDFLHVGMPIELYSHPKHVKMIAEGPPEGFFDQEAADIVLLVLVYDPINRCSNLGIGLPNLGRLCVHWICTLDDIRHELIGVLDWNLLSRFVVIPLALWLITHVPRSVCLAKCPCSWSVSWECSFLKRSCYRSSHSNVYLRWSLSSCFHDQKACVSLLSQFFAHEMTLKRHPMCCHTKRDLHHDELVLTKLQLMCEQAF